MARSQVLGVAGEFSSPGSTLCADSYFSIRRKPEGPGFSRVPAGVMGEFSFPGSTFYADFYFGICSTPVLPQ